MRIATIGSGYVGRVSGACFADFGHTVVVTKSTVPVGTGDEVERILREARPDVELSVALDTMALAWPPAGRRWCCSPPATSTRKARRSAPATSLPRTCV